MSGSTPSSIKELKLDNIFDNAVTNFVLLYDNLTIEKLNKAAAKLFESEDGDLKGVDFRTLICQSDIGKFEAYLEACKDGLASATIEKINEVKMIRKDQKVIFTEVDFITSELDGRLYYLGFIRDKSKMKRLESEVEKQKEIKQKAFKKLEEEKELNELKTGFLSMASHEFKTPLSGILSSLQLVQRYLTAEGDHWKAFRNRDKIETHFNKIKSSVADLNLILDDFLLLGRLNDRKVRFHSTLFELPQFFNSVTQDLLPICKTGQKITYNHSGDNKKIYLDKHILKIIVRNLIYNAIKYSGENKTIQLISQAEENQITITVLDEGIGIPMPDQKHIFSKFYRATNARNYQGTGLGLSIVKKYVELMNGQISFESEENEGSAFRISFSIPNKSK